jgi:hypothetical protein
VHLLSLLLYLHCAVYTFVILLNSLSLSVLGKVVILSVLAESSNDSQGNDQCLSV